MRWSLLNLIPRRKIREMIDEEDLCMLMARPSKDYVPWLQKLPDAPVAGLADRCWSWIRSWGNGGGDLSTEQCVQAAIEMLKSDSPRALAEAIFDNTANYSKTEFEASCLVMLLMDESLQECQAGIGIELG